MGIAIQCDRKVSIKQRSRKNHISVWKKHGPKVRNLKPDTMKKASSIKKHGLRDLHKLLLKIFGKVAATKVQISSVNRITVSKVKKEAERH